MIVLLEGADGSGKTTLASQLNDIWPVIRFGIHNRNIEHMYYSLIKATKGDAIVADRSFITELVYRIALGDGQTDDMQLQSMLDILENCVVIYCKTKTQFDDAQHRGETNITDLATSKKISDCYDGVMRVINTRTPAHVLSYDWHNDNVDTLIKSIKEIVYGL